MPAMPAVTTTMTAMSTMTAVHEHVQEWACEEEEQRQPPQGVDPVLGEKEEQRNSRECQEHEHRTRASSAPILD